MRSLIAVLAVAMLSVPLAGIGRAPAPGGMVLYDDFRSARINPDKWFGQDFGFTEIDRRDQVREILSNTLRLASSIYGDPVMVGGNRNGGSRVRFTRPESVTAIQATVRVWDAAASGCTTGGPATTRGTIQGFFFNDGSSTSSSDRTGEYSAGVGISRASNSLDPPGVLRASGFAFRCSNASCSSSVSIGSVSLGTVTLKEKTSVLLQWDEANAQFVYQLGEGAPVSVAYSVASHAPPVVNSKIIDVSNSVNNCGAGVRSEAYMDLRVDDVFVNAVP